MATPIRSRVEGMDHWQDQRETRGASTIQEARVKVHSPLGKPCMPLHRWHHDEMYQASSGFFTKLTGKVIADVCLAPSCSSRGVEPGNEMKRREPRRRLCPHPALQGWSERLEPPALTRRLSWSLVLYTKGCVFNP